MDLANRFRHNASVFDCNGPKGPPKCAPGAQEFTMADNNFRPLTDEELNTIKENAKGISDVVSLISRTFKSSDRREQLRPRKGADSFQRALFIQAKLHHINLEGYDIEEVQKAQELVRQLQDLSSHLKILNKTVSDTLLAANGFVWDSTLNYYRVLNAVAIGNSNLAIAMKPIQEFMSRSNKKADKDDADVLDGEE